MDIEEFIFNTYKDGNIISKTFKEEIIKKYNVSKEQARNIFVRINNYQVKTYGERITKLVDVFLPEEMEKINQNARMRKYCRRTYERKN